MHRHKPTPIHILVLAALAIGLLPAIPALAATVSIEGVVTGGPEPECVLVKDSQGNSFLLEGTGWYGIIGNDYVRLDGTVVPENRCGVTSGIQVANVSTIWRDEAHKVIVYERSTGRFADWVRAHREREWREWEAAHHIPPPPPPASVAGSREPIRSPAAPSPKLSRAAQGPRGSRRLLPPPSAGAGKHGCHIFLYKKLT